MRVLSPKRSQQPHDMKVGERFDPACIYVNDQGECYCGEHVGVEASFCPQAWSCLGLGPEYVHVEDGETIRFRCEIPH